jgi:RNase adaptor protein for sRNA GlmZ degradation
VNAADLVVDTSRMGVHELRELINRRVGKRPRDRMSVLFESFGFKHGIPGRCRFRIRCALAAQSLLGADRCGR